MRIYLDTNVFVIAVEHTGKLNDRVQELMKRGQRAPGLLVTSELTLAELLVKPFQLRSEEGITSALRRALDHPIALTPGTLAAIYADLISQRPGLQVCPIERDVLVLSAFHRADDNSIKLPDAIHLATAERADCTHILSGDRKLRPSHHFNFQRVDLQLRALEGLLESLE